MNTGTNKIKAIINGAATTLLLFLSLHSFAQSEKQIFLQTSPEDQYTIAYTFNGYTLLFAYNDFMESLQEDEKTMQAIRAWIDTQIKSKGFFDLSLPDQTFYVNNEATGLEEVTNNRTLSELIDSGNMIIQDASGKPNVSSLVKVKTSHERSSVYTYTDPVTGKIVMENEIRYFRISGCPSF